MIYFTSSWDDGSEYDIKLSEIMLKHSHRATFYIPLKNVEKRNVILPTQIRELSNNFEIGAHTINHVYLNRLSLEEAKNEIEQPKIELELITGIPVYGLCFPGGKYIKEHLEIAYQAGYTYTRTIRMFHTVNRTNLLNTTLQVHDHSSFVYYRHLLKTGYIGGLLDYFSIIFRNNRQWDKLFGEILEKLIADDSEDKISIIHLWGHSWELEEFNHWSRLENILELINNHQIETKTNYEITNLMLHI